MGMKNLKFVEYSIVFQEVPDEISLVFTISNCPYKCDGCHSKYLWEDNGFNLLENLDNILNNYKDLITCVCFMGGDQNESELNKAIDIVRKYNIKTCLYTGSDDLYKFNNIIDSLNYIKIGRYIKELGGLDSINTNQIFYKNNDGNLEDITYLFRKENQQ